MQEEKSATRGGKKYTAKKVKKGELKEKENDDPFFEKLNQWLNGIEDEELDSDEEPKKRKVVKKESGFWNDYGRNIVYTLGAMTVSYVLNVFSQSLREQYVKVEEKKKEEVVEPVQHETNILTTVLV
jgi:hypothetical protein